MIPLKERSKQDHVLRHAASALLPPRATGLEISRAKCDEQHIPRLVLGLQRRTRLEDRQAMTPEQMQDHVAFLLADERAALHELLDQALHSQLSYLKLEAERIKQCSQR